MTEQYRILIVTDLEGVCGVLDFDNWCLPGGRRDEEGRGFLTAQTNAAIAGFFEGGAAPDSRGGRGRHQIRTESRRRARVRQHAGA